MAGNDLTARQRRFIAAMMTARTVAEAARMAGIAERTARRYLADPDVKAVLSAALDDALAQVTRRTVEAMAGALDTLEAVQADAEAAPSARVAAARVVMVAGPKLREAVDLAERVANLERRGEGAR